MKNNTKINSGLNWLYLFYQDIYSFIFLLVHYLFIYFYIYIYLLVYFSLQVLGLHTTDGACKNENESLQNNNRNPLKFFQYAPLTWYFEY